MLLETFFLANKKKNGKFMRIYNRNYILYKNKKSQDICAYMKDKFFNGLDNKLSSAIRCLNNFPQGKQTGWMTESLLFG